MSCSIYILSAISTPGVPKYLRIPLTLWSAWWGALAPLRPTCARFATFLWLVAVLAALCHRSLIVHGLVPQLGVHHKPRYRSDPLVYDLMEPFRPAVDLMLAEFMVEPEISMKAWAKKVGTELRDRRVRRGTYTLKLMDAIDASANSLARAYAELSAARFWVPELAETGTGP